MSLITFTHDADSIILRVKILDSSVSTGAGLTGLTFASSGLIISTIADNEATATAYTASGSLIETITTLGTYAAPTATKCRFKEVDATNHPGVYEIQLADARFAVSSAKFLLISITGATNAADTDALVPLTQVDPYDNVRFGITALPNAAADAAGGLPVSDAGGLDLDTLLGYLTAAVATASALATAQADLDTITGTDGVTLATSQTLYTPATSTALATAQTDLDTITGATGVNIDSTAQSTLVQAIWDALTSALTTPSSIGKKLADWVFGTDSKVLISTDAQDLSTSLDVNTKAWASTAVTTSATSLLPEVDAKSISDATIAADDLETNVANLANADAPISTVDTVVDGIATTLGTPIDFGSGTSTIAANLQDMADDGVAVYDRSTDSLQAIRDRGDAAWTTGSITDILNTHFLIPTSIDLANTATVRLGMMLTNALDDLPSTAEITPGTISIERKAIGGTSWSAVVTDAACSEAAGHVYYDEVFDSGTGYAEGDSLRLTFKSQKITVAANDYEITDATGVMIQTEIRQTMRGTDSAALASALSTAQADLDTLTGTDGVTLATSQPNYAPATAAALTTHDGKLDTVDGIVDAILLDTAEIGAAGAGLTNLGGMSTAMKAEVNAEADTALSDYDAPTKAEMDTLIGTPAGADVSADIATAQADLDILTGTDGALLATTGQPAGWPANLQASAGQIIKATVDTVTNTHTPTTTEFQADDITEATADHYNGRVVIFTSGVLAGQATSISDYEAVGGIGQFTVVAMTEAPSNNDTFIIV